MSELDALRVEVQSLRLRNEALERRVTDAEQGMEALARGEVDAVAIDTSGTPILLLAAQEGLRRNERLLRAVFEGALDAMLLSNDQGTYIDANPAACTLVGLSRQELIGRASGEVVEPGERYDGECAEGAATGEGERPRRRLLLWRGDGAERIVEYAVVASVAPGLHLSLMRDITDRIQAEDALLRSEALFRAVIEKSSEVVSLTTAEGATRYLTPLAAQRLGWTAEQMATSTIGDLVVEEDRPLIVSAFARMVREGSRDMFLEFRVRHADGSIRWIESAATNLLDDPSVRSIVGNYRDITARKLDEEAVRDSRNLLEEAQAIAHVGSWTLRLGTNQKVAWSPEARRIFGLQPDTMMSDEAWVDCVHPEDRELVIRAYQDAIEHDTPYDFDYRILLPDGSLRWAHGRAAVERDAQGRATRVLGSVQDITDRYVAIAALRASEERYRVIIETTSEGVWLSDAEYRTTYVNQRMAEMLGHPREEMIGEAIWGFLTPEGAATARLKMERRRDDGSAETYQNAYRRKDGSTCWALAKTNPIHDESGAFLGTVALLTDVAEQRELEQARDHLAAIVTSSGDAIIGVTLDGVITSWNHGAEKLYQYRADEIVGHPILGLVPPEGEEEQQRILERVARGEPVQHFDAKRIRKDGSVIEVALTVSPIRDGAGQIVSISKIARDLTMQRQAEAAHQRTETHYRQAQKMEAVGRLAGGIAHDFNNLLSVVLSYASLAMDDLKVGDPLRDDLQEIETAGERATELTRQLLAFSRQQILQPTVVELNRIITGMGAMLRRLLGEDVQLTMLLDPDLGRTVADPGQLEQVVMNLAVNARDAMPQGGTLTIATSNVELDGAAIGGSADLVAGSYILLTTSDTGVGMDAETRARVFEPFFTTKALGKGTGLGLATVFGIVQQSGGNVSVYSELGVGTSFKVHLPRTDLGAEAMTPRPPTAVGGCETILLVEDEAQVRAVACTILRRHGYNVLEASNGGEAYLMSREFPAKIHLLLTDVVMPRMSGRKLSEELAPQRPDMKILFASGYTDDAIIHHGVLDAGVALLQKPFTPGGLLRKVREVLDAKV